MGLARLGVPSRLLARLSDDRYGTLIRAHLTRNGVDLRHAVSATEPSTVVTITLDRDGSPHFGFQTHGAADWQWRDAELDGALDPDPADGAVVAVHSGSSALAVPPGAAVLRRMLARARDNATISYDPNCRLPLIGDPPQALAGVHEMLGVADVVKASAEDLAYLLPGAGAAQVLTEWLARGPALVVVTLGAGGVLAATAATAVLHRPARAVAVVDTVGAGDTFAAALLAGLRERGLLGADRRPVLRALDEGTLGTLLDEANLAAALTCTRRGADPPTTAEITAARGRNRLGP